MGTYVVVVGGGPLPPRTESPHSPNGARRCAPAAVVTADSGLDVALAAGLAPTLLVGDLDSVSAAGLEWARASGLATQTHPADKDATDTALALSAAATLARGDTAADLHVLCGSANDRLDHLLGIVAALGAADLDVFDTIRADIGATDVRVVHSGHAAQLDLATGAVFSLLALHGACTAVDVERARWPLVNASIGPSATIGISNESIGDPVTVRCAGGVLTVVVPPVAS